MNGSINEHGAEDRQDLRHVDQRLFLDLRQRLQKRDTTRPTMRATIIKGPATFRKVRMPSRAMSRRAAPVHQIGIRMMSS